jgi:hypothetical protein
MCSRRAEEYLSDHRPQDPELLEWDERSLRLWNPLTGGVASISDPTGDMREVSVEIGGGGYEAELRPNPFTPLLPCFSTPRRLRLIERQLAAPAMMECSSCAASMVTAAAPAAPDPCVCSLMVMPPSGGRGVLPQQRVGQHAARRRTLGAQLAAGRQQVLAAAVWANAGPTAAWHGPGAAQLPRAVDAILRAA